MAPQGINWCFTLNNYTDQEYATIAGLEHGVQYLIVGKEIGLQGTPHLQGYVQFTAKKRLTAVKSLLGVRAHLEVARGGYDANRKYCSKDGEWCAIGVPRLVGSDKTKLKFVVDKMLKDGPDPKALYDEFGDTYITHEAKINKMYHMLVSQSSRQDLVGDAVLKEWQATAVDTIKNQDERTVTFYVDFAGNVGKSFLAKYLVSREGAVLFNTTTLKDVAFAWQRESIVLFDMCRSALEHINYGTFEAFKNGVVFSSKYESCNKYQSGVKVVVFMNEDPDMSKLSADRYQIIHL